MTRSHVLNPSQGNGGRAFSSEENHYEAVIDCCRYFYSSMYRCYQLEHAWNRSLELATNGSISNGDKLLPTRKRFTILIVSVAIGLVVLDDLIARLIHWVLLH